MKIPTAPKKPSLRSTRHEPRSAGVSLMRALSKLGHCSRTQAAVLIRAGQVRCNGRICVDPCLRVDLATDALEVEGVRLAPAPAVYLMLNKPRGLLTTRQDERARATVYDCLQGLDLAHLAPVGRLDKASEGLLLFSNDTRWAAGLTDPQRHVNKLYHVQIDQSPTPALIEALQAGVRVQEDWLQVKAAAILRCGERHGWLEVTLDEGRNRHLRRLLGALGVNVLRLVRIGIGPLRLGALPKGAFRHLTPAEVETLRAGRRENGQQRARR